MKERIKKIIEDFDREKVLVENKRIKTKYKKLKDEFDVLYIETMSAKNEILIQKEENKHLQIQKRQYLNAYKHKKEELRRIKMMLMQDGTTLKDIKNALGVK